MSGKQITLEELKRYTEANAEMFKAVCEVEKRFELTIAEVLLMLNDASKAFIKGL